MNTRTINKLFIIAITIAIIFSSCYDLAELVHGPRPEPPPVTFTVTFNANGASGTAPATQTVNEGTVISLPDKGDLTKVGNVFIGWSENVSSSSTVYAVGFSVTVTRNMVFYAQWLDSSTPPFTVTFNANGATSGVPPSAVTEYSGISIILPNQGTLAYSGKTFSGWNTLANGTGSNYAAGNSYTVTENIIMYAQWINTPSEVAGSYTVNSSSTFASAITSINSSTKSGTYTITVTASFSCAAASFTSNAEKTIILQGSGGNRILYNNSSDVFFSVPNRITLSLENNITVNGNQKPYAAVKVSSGGMLNMAAGTIITGSVARNVWVNGGTFIMNGGTISENYAGNSSSVDVDNRGFFTFKSGTISGNTSSDAGGGVSVSNATFNMEGGNIQGNISNYRGGGGVYVGDDGIFNMSSGTIAYNTAQANYYSYGGGVFVSDTGNFNMTGGLITGNTVTAGNTTYGGGVYISNGGTFTKIGGGTIDNTNSAQYGRVACVGSSSYIYDPTVRNTTATPSDDMDSGIAGINGGWE